MRDGPSRVTTGIQADKGLEPVGARFVQVDFNYPSGTAALQGLSLDLARGQVTAIIGPSGCGKSTLLQLLSGLLNPTAGRVELNLDTSGRHRLAMVFQKDTLLPWMTLRDNVCLFARLNGKHRSPDVKAKTKELLDMVGLAEFGDMYPKQLSGGMQRRAAFLASVAAEPQFLLLDEPFSSVDEPTRIQIHQDVLRIVSTLETTTVLVTHDLAEAITMSNRVVVLSSRPARVAAVRDIEFGHDRDVMSLRDRPDFLDAYGSLWHDLSREIGRGQPD